MTGKLATFSCLLVGLWLLPACGSDSSGGGGAGGGSSAGGSGGKDSGGSGGSSGAPSTGTGALGKPCTAASQCASVLGYQGVCFADFPNGGFCSHECNDDGDCFQDNTSTDHFTCAQYQAKDQCLLSCVNHADLSMPLACPTGLTCDGKVCRPN